MTTHVRCVLVGDGSLTVHAAQSLIDGGHTIVAAVTDEPAVEGLCRRHDIRVLRFSKSLAEQLSSESFDMLFSVVNLRLLPSDVLALPSRMAINFHDGPLPDWAGVNVTTWGLLHGRTTHGVTWHVMQGEADTGDVLKATTFDIADDETSFSLNAKCYAAGMSTFDELLRDLEADALKPVAQDLSTRTYFDFYDRPPRGAVLDFAAGTDSVLRTVRALDFGAGYDNPLGAAKVATGHGLVLVGAAESAPGSGSAGTLLEVSREGLTVATSDGAVALTKLRNADGRGLDGAGALAVLGVVQGASVGLDDVDGFEAASKATARGEGFIRRRLLAAQDETLYLGASHVAPRGAQRTEANLVLPSPSSGAAACGMLFAALGRLSGREQFQVAVSNDALVAASQKWGGALSAWVPHRPTSRTNETLAAWAATAERQLAAAADRGPWLRDLVARTPGLAEANPDGVRMGVHVHLGEQLPPDVQAPVRFWVKPDGAVTCSVAVRAGEQSAEPLAARIAGFAAAAARGGAVDSIDIVTDAERAFLLEEVNRTAREVSESDTLDAAFARQVQKTPDAPALTVGDDTLTYAQLDERARGVAQALAARGVGPGHRVGIFIERSADMMVAVLGTLQSGAAYTPLDPAYPEARVSYMIDDAKLSAILVSGRTQGRLVGHDDVALEVGSCSPQDKPLAPRATGGDLAYVIYTSGSTGRPKGVMVEHHNVINFFAAMDEVVTPADEPRWLAVTSLNFDISVLELLYTLCRGFEVVLYRDAERASSAAEGPAAGPAIDFSLFYFSADEGEPGDKYRLLIEGAKFGDAHGFCAVWTPERHFHAFGGLYPNPSVTGAAVAMVTQNVQIRSGSCVSPLHSPIRVAEEWSVVDNLSGGRVGLSFAAGWQPNDFAIRPHTFKNRKEQMLEDIDTVKRLWRGEAVAFEDGTGKTIDVRTLPRPIQPELPVWVTAAGNPETFRAAGERGSNLLTHLLGQTLDELTEKIRVYREAYAAAGHPGRGTVSLMLHTYVGETDHESRETAREPMKHYLKSAVGLVQKAAWSFPTFKKSTTLDDGSFSTSHLSDEEMDALLSFSFERYFDTSGLFGSVETATAFAHEVAKIDADEIACLIDFGVPTDKVLEQLPRLAQVLQRQQHSGGEQDQAPAQVHASAAELLKKHQVTHVQCTPSMARMWMADDDTRAALRDVSQILIGGEAFPAPLARDLLSLNDNVHNMYGPTETTIWSSTHKVEPRVPSVPIGRPIANTDMLILDDNRRLVPPGTPGELYIGGRGVVRGYFERSELTDERFVKNPFGEGRLYRTGDVAQVRPDGVFEFLGRADDQVKVRGHRIELGEIETALSSHDAVSSAVVIARDDDGTGPRLVGYVIPRGQAEPDAQALREHLRERLPEHMVPADFVTLDAFPHTPNKKIDKKALPAPKRAAPRRASTAPPQNDTEETIARIWSAVLGIDNVGTDENFFDLGGHSLQTVEVLVQVKKEISPTVTLVDLFRYPTIGSLAQALQGGEGGDNAATAGQKRAEARMKRRNQRRRGA